MNFIVNFLCNSIAFGGAATSFRTAFAHSMSTSKQGLKLFNTLSTHTPLPQHHQNSPEDIHSSSQQQGTHKWGWFFAATHAQSLPIERLLLKTINAELGIPGSVPDVYAVALRSALLPSWRYKIASTFLAKQYKNFVESGLYGVPGLLSYLDARARWIDGHVIAAAQEGVQQIVVLGGGFDTRALRIGASLPSLKVRRGKKNPYFPKLH